MGSPIGNTLKGAKLPLKKMPLSLSKKLSALIRFIFFSGKANKVDYKIIPES